MSEPIEALILQALWTHLIEPVMVTPMPLVIAPLAAVTTPDAGVRYYEAHRIMRAEPFSDVIAFDDTSLLKGIFQVDAVTPMNQGELPGIRMASLVAERFKRGTTLDIGSTVLRILERPEIAAAIKDVDRLRFPVSINYTVEL